MAYQTGNTIRLRTEFRDFDDNLVDPADVNLTIYRGNREIVDEFPIGDIVQEDVGIYYYDYIIPDITSPYLYYEWLGLIDGTPSLKRQRLDHSFE